jgi:predicted acyltransferase
MKRHGVPASSSAEQIEPISARRTERLRSLDVMRGVVVAGMIVVNMCMVGAGFRQFVIYPVLAHADWVSFTVADFVFPAFILMVGVSIALSSKGSRTLDPGTVKRIVGRSVRLFAVGFLLTNLLYQWMHGWSFDGGFRLLGVLQRISLCYAAAALLQNRLSDGAILGVAMAVLVLYVPLTLVPIPDGTRTDLWTEGTNFVSWIDRVALSTHRWVEGPTGYDTEGLLSTLPAMAQCLLGVLAGRWLATHASKAADTVRLVLLGSLLVGVGCIWGVWFPIVKSLWSSSFVILSTGLALLMFALIRGLIAMSRGRPIVSRFFEVFGVNAIVAYVLHFFCYFGLALPFIPNFYAAIASFAPPALANLFIACLLTLVVWCPLMVMYQRGVRVSI